MIKKSKPQWMLLILILLGISLMSGCATTGNNIIFPSVTTYIGSTDFAKYQRVAVLPFVDAPNAPFSGQIIQGLVSQQFAKWNFIVVERAKLDELLKEQYISLSGAIDPSKSIELGKILGVNALIMGEVTQFDTQQKRTETVYFPIAGNYYPVPGKQWSENYVSISLRVVDVETGRLIYSGAGQFNAGLANPHQEISIYLINEIIGKWVTSPGMCGFKFTGENKDNKVIITIIEVLPHSPADIVGVRVGDKILKVKDKDVANLSSIEFYSLTWGYPGEVMPLEVERDGEIIKFNIKRISTEEIVNMERQRQQQPNSE